MYLKMGLWPILTSLIISEVITADGREMGEPLQLLMRPIGQTEKKETFEYHIRCRNNHVIGS